MDARPTLFLLLLIFVPATLPAEPTLEARHRTIHRTSGEVEIDGVLDEAAWDDALVFDLPYEWNPGDNVPPPVETEFLTTYDDEHLYVAWRAFDPEPAAIRANLMDRDEIDTFVQDDHVVLLIDTFNDERRAYQFRVNPLGVQADAINSENEGVEDWAFDMIWKSAGKIGEEGYVVEVAIPFDQLRFPRTAETMTWGFDVGRSYPRSVRHRITSYPRDRDRSCGLCQVDKVEGFKDLRPGRNLEVTPTFTANRTERLDTFPEGSLESDGEDTDVGVSVRWGITPNMTLNAALNPDFSQVEADVAQLEVNTRFALFFPEKRPFFLEGSDFFQTPLRAVFTRTVVDPDWGLKLSGKEGKNAFGVFAAEDNVTSLLFPSNQGSSSTLLDEGVSSAVVRYRRDVGANSSLGALYTGRSGGDYMNDVYGADGFFRLDDTNTLSFQVLRSETRYPEAVAADFGQDPDGPEGDAFFANWSRFGRFWSWQVEYRDIEPGFRADSGFITRVDQKRGVVWLRRSFWGDEDDWYDRINVATFHERVEDQSGRLTDESAQVWVNVAGPMQSFAEVGYAQDAGLFRDVFHDDMGRKWLFFQAQPSGAVSFEVFVEDAETIDFANNRQADSLVWAPAVEAKLGRHFNVRLDHTLQRLELPEGKLFTANLTQARLVYNLNVRTFVRAIFQYLDLERDPALHPFPVEPQTETLFTQLLFSYKVNPQTVIFAGYSDNRLGINGIPLTQTDRTLFLKLGYAWTL